MYDIYIYIYVQEDMSQPKFPRGISELTDNDAYKRIAMNTFRDCYGDAAETLT